MSNAVRTQQGDSSLAIPSYDLAPFPSNRRRIMLSSLGIVAVAIMTAAVAIGVPMVTGNDDANAGSDLSGYVPTSSNATAAIVTADEFEKFRVGLSLPEVEQLFGGPGIQTSVSESAGTTIVGYRWPGEAEGTGAVIAFQDGKASASSKFGLS